MAWYEVLVAVVSVIFGSSGAWTYFQARRSKDDTRDKLLKGIAYNVIISQAKHHLAHGEITASEFTDIYNAVYIHYKQMGGNGTAERLMKELEKLPLNKDDIL